MSQTDIIDNMVSIGMLNGAEYGLGKVTGSRKLTKEDIRIADEMDQEIIRKQHAVIDHSYDK